MLMLAGVLLQRSLKRFWDSGEVPPLSPAQEEAIQVLEAIAMREAMHMVLVSPENGTKGMAAIADTDVSMTISQEVGDIQFVSGVHLLHARTGEQRTAGDNKHACPTCPTYAEALSSSLEQLTSTTLHQHLSGESGRHQSRQEKG